MERTYTDEELEAMKPENRPKILFDGKEYDDYQATQMQRRIEVSIRKQKRLKTAYEAAGLKEDSTAANIKLRRLNQKYKEFSKAAGLPEQSDRVKVLYDSKLTDIPKFSALKEYDGKIKVIDQFSPRHYVVKLDAPIISGSTQHFLENLSTKTDRAGLTVDEAQSIIRESKLSLWQPQNQTIKFLADNGYVVINLKKKLVTAVPEKLRKKYRDYLEGK